MQKELKERFIFNIKLFIIGSILWIVIFGYLQQHPGEKQSLIPSLQTLYNKGELMFYNILGYNSTNIETKQSLQKMYTEIAYLIEASQCDDEALLKEVEMNKKAIDALEYTQAENNKYNYYLKAVDLKNKIESQCTTGGTITQESSTTGSIQTGTI